MVVLKAEVKISAEYYDCREAGACQLNLILFTEK